MIVNFTYTPTDKMTGDKSPWSMELDVAKLPQTTIDYAVVRGIHEALKDSFAGAKTDVEFAAALNKKWDALHAEGHAPYVPGGRGAGQPKDPRSEMVRRVAAEWLRGAAKAAQKRLPKADSDDYKTLFEKFSAANAEKIEAEADVRLAKAESMEITMPDGF